MSEENNHESSPQEPASNTQEQQQSNPDNSTAGATGEQSTSGAEHPNIDTSAEEQQETAETSTAVDEDNVDSTAQQQSASHNSDSKKHQQGDESDDSAESQLNSTDSEHSSPVSADEQTHQLSQQDDQPDQDNEQTTNNSVSRPNLIVNSISAEEVNIDQPDLDDVSPIPMVQTGGTGPGSLYDFENDDDDEDYNYSSFNDKLGSSTSEDTFDDKLGPEKSLEQVLAMDHVVQDLQLSNENLLSILKKPENILKLIKYISEPHYVDNPESFEEKDFTEEEEFELFKFPYVAQQIFLVQHEDVNPLVVESEGNLKQLFGFLLIMDSTKQTTSPYLQQFYAKTMSIFLKDYYTPMAKYIMSMGEDLLKAVINNVEAPEMHSLTLKLLGYEPQDDSVVDGWREMIFVDSKEPDREVEEHKKLVRQWALDHGFVSHVLAKLKEDVEDSNAAENMFTLLEVIVETETLLADALLSQEFLGALLDFVLENPESSLFQHCMQFMENIFVQVEKRPDCLSAVFDRTKSFVDLLDRTPSSSIYTPHGKIDPPLGEHRLLATRHIWKLYSTQNADVGTMLHDHAVLSKLVTLFFQYPFNNLLHCQCCNIFESILESDNVNVIMNLLSHGQLLKLIFATFTKEYTQPLISAVGYMGHLVKIGNALTRAMEAPQIDQFVKSFEEWTTFRDFIREENRKNSLHLGGDKSF